MRTEQEICDAMAACNNVAGWGMSEGPCPFRDDGREGCCAECSTPSTISWVLGGDEIASNNGQHALAEAIQQLAVPE